MSKGDGNCGWRGRHFQSELVIEDMLMLTLWSALVYGYFEAMWRRGDSDVCFKEIDRLRGLARLSHVYCNPKLDEWLYEEWAEEAFKIHRRIATLDPHERSNTEELVAIFNTEADADTSAPADDIVQYFRVST